MKSTLKLPSFLLACGSLLAVSSVHAADVTWDTVGPGNGTVTGGAGTWNTTITNWTTNAGANNVAWVNGNNDTAIFGGTAGTVTLGADVTVGGLTFNTNNYSIAPGAGPFKITFGAPGDIDVSTGTSTISAEIAGSSTITKTGNGTLQLNAVNSFTGDTVISAGTLRLGTNNNTGTLGPAIYNGNISIASGALLDMTNNNTQTFNGIISGAGDLQKRGGGTLTLAGANTYTGKTFIGGPGGGGRTVVVSSFNSVVGGVASSSLGAPTTVDNGTIELGDGGNFRNSTLRYTGSGETTDRVMKLNFNSSSKHAIEANTTGGGLLKFTSQFTINPSSGNTGGGFTMDGSGDGEITAGFGGSFPGYLDKAGAGTWTLGGNSNANTMSVRGGRLEIGGSGTLDSGSYAGDISIASTSSGTLKFNSTADQGLSGVISGAGALIKDNTGTLTITNGSNSLSGATTINGGTLAVNGSGTLGTSDVTIAGGAFIYNSSVAYTNTFIFTSGTLGGTNLTGGLGGQTIGANQTLSPGNSPGTANTVGQIWDGGGSYLWEINDATGTAGSDPGWDLVNGTGTLNINAASGDPFTILVTSLTLGNIAGSAVNFDELTDYEWLLADFASITGFAANAFSIDTSDFTNSFTGDFGISLGGVGVVPGDNTQIYLTYTAASVTGAIPEPSAAFLGCLGALLLLRRRR